MSETPEVRRTGLRWKVYRIAYWAFTIGLAASVSLSVTYYAIRAAGTTAQVPDDAGSGADCDAELARLYVTLRQEGGRLMASPSSKMARAWRTWSAGWRHDYEGMRARCTAHGAPNQSALSKRAKDLERVHLAYTTAFRGFADVGRKPLKRIEARPGARP